MEMNNRLTTGQGETVGGQDLVNGLEVGNSTAGAVTRASRGDTLGLGARVPGTSRVTGLSADIGLSKTSNAALRVVDSGAESANSSAVDTGGGSRAANASSDGGSSAARNSDGTAGVVVDGARECVPAAATDVAVVTASGED